MSPAEQKIPAAIRNEFFYAIARLCMVASMPLIAFFGTRIIATVDEIRAQVAAQNIALQVLTSEVKYRFAHVEDHENRIRKLELGQLR